MSLVLVEIIALPAPSPLEQVLEVMPVRYFHQIAFVGNCCLYGIFYHGLLEKKLLDYIIFRITFLNDTAIYPRGFALLALLALIGHCPWGDFSLSLRKLGMPINQLFETDSHCVFRRMDILLLHR